MLGKSLFSCCCATASLELCTVNRYCGGVTVRHDCMGMHQGQEARRWDMNLVRGVDGIISHDLLVFPAVMD
jgi:hypothetical protein